MTSDADRPRRWPDRLIALATGAVAVLGVVLAELDPDHLSPSIAVVFGAFLVGSVASSVLRCVTQPGGVAATVAVFGRTGRNTRSTSTAGQLDDLCVPRRLMWLLPLAVLPAVAATLPIGLHESPGDWSIVGALALIVLGFGYAGIALGLVVWLLLVLPTILIGRAVNGRRHGRALSRGEWIAAGVAVVLLTVVLFATADTLAFHTHGSSSHFSHRSIHLPELFGAGDQSSPWWWVARAAGLGLVLEVVAFRRLAGPRRRRRDIDGRGPGQVPG